MNVAEKCALLKADMDALHKAGGNTEEAFEQGRQDVISKSKYIPKTASGKGVFLNDVSEVAHKVKVYADTPTEVKVCGKNLFDVSKVTNKDNSAGKMVNNGDGSITVTAVGTSSEVMVKDVVLKDLAPMLVAGQTCVINADSTGTLKQVYFNDTKKSWLFNTELVLTEDDLDSRVSFYASGNETTATIKDIQIEVGSVATPYEPYQEPQTITATPNGTEADSICPAMNFLTDSEITVDYYSSYGRQAEYDEFWGYYQDYGNKTDYRRAFGGYGWNDDTFRPKYSMRPINATMMFADSKITNLKKLLEECGVELDFSGVTYDRVSQTFADSAITDIGIFDISSCSSVPYVLYRATKLVNVERFIVNSDGRATFTNNSFINCSALEHIIFEGTIASDINLQWSKDLDLESLISLFACLMVYTSGDADYMTKTITLPAAVWELTNHEEFLYVFDGNNGEMCRIKGWKKA